MSTILESNEMLQIFLQNRFIMSVHIYNHYVAKAYSFITLVYGLQRVLNGLRDSVYSV